MKVNIPEDLKLDQMNLAKYIVTHHSKFTRAGLFIGNRYIASRVYTMDQLRQKAIDMLYNEFRNYYELLGFYVCEILTEQKEG